MCIWMQINRVHSLKILQSISEFGGLWKHQNNPACTQSVKSLQNVEVGHSTDVVVVVVVVVVV